MQEVKLNFLWYVSYGSTSSYQPLSGTNPDGKLDVLLLLINMDA